MSALTAGTPCPTRVRCLAAYHGVDEKVRRPRADDAGRPPLRKRAPGAPHRAPDGAAGSMLPVNDPHAIRRFTALVSGHVQGVGYRAFVRRQATDLGVKGHVENLRDGRVEVVAEGFQDDLDVLLVQLRRGPTHAEVVDVEVEWADGGGALPGFHVY